MGCVRVSFKEVDQKIRLHQNLIIESIYMENVMSPLPGGKVK